MTLLDGEVMKAHGFNELIQVLEIEPDEIFDVLPEDDKRELLRQFNELHPEHEDAPVESVDGLPDFVREEWREWVQVYPQTIAIEVMDARDEEYVHTTHRSEFGENFHTVMEVEYDE